MRHVGKTSSPQPSARLAADFHPGGRLANAPGPGSPAPGSEKFGRQAALLLWSPSAELLVTDWPRNAATETPRHAEVFGRVLRKPCRDIGSDRGATGPRTPHACRLARVPRDPTGSAGRGARRVRLDT